jgi:hypothetical protein
VVGFYHSIAIILRELGIHLYAGVISNRDVAMNGCMLIPGWLTIL